MHVFVFEASDLLVEDLFLRSTLLELKALETNHAVDVPFTLVGARALSLHDLVGQLGTEILE